MTPTPSQPNSPKLTPVAAEPVTTTLDPWTDPATVAVTKDGRVIRQIDEDELDAQLPLQYSTKVAKSVRHQGQKKEIQDHAFLAASEWLILQLFTIDGNPLTIDHITGKHSQNPDSVGPYITGILSTLSQKIIGGTPEGKD